MMTRTTIGAILIGIVFIAGSAYAHDADDADSGWRIGGSAMTSELKRDDGLLDDGEIGFKLFGQYKFNSWLGLEGAYYNSGEFASSATSAGGSKVELLYQGGLGQVYGYIPMPWEGFELFVKGGYFAFNVDSKIDGSNSGKGSDNGAVVGTGFSIHVTPSMHFRTAFDWYDADGADLWSVELGLEYHF